MSYKRGYHKLTSAQKAALIADYVAGIPLKCIAKAYGVDKSYPCKIASRRNIARRVPAWWRNKIAHAHSERRYYR